MKKHIDINCDVGEGVANEAELFPYITSCSVACGGHFGTRATIAETVKRAVAHSVKIGAHPSYPDKNNFGRVSMDMPKKDFICSMQSQMHAIATVLQEQKVKLHHIKPHGALYNDMISDALLANSFLEAIGAYKSTVYLYVPYGSAIATEALKQGFLVTYEAFADRNYNNDLSLVSRTLKSALIKEPTLVLEHIKNMVVHQKVRTLHKTLVPIKAETFCVHGDTSSAVEILKCLHKELYTFTILVK